MPKFHELTVKEVRRETADCVSVIFDIPKELEDNYLFIQGQYLTLRQNINDEDVRRSYSISSGVDDGEVRVAIKKVPGGVFSTYANEVLKAGDTMKVMTPMGRFYTELDAANEKHYVGFAAGSGITPILSIIKSVLSREPKSTFTLFYGNKESASVIFKEEIEDLKDTHLQRLRVFHLLTREPSEIPLLAGRIDLTKCGELYDQLLQDRDVDEVFSCGPIEMINAVKDTMMAKGLAPENIHFELFTSPLVAQQQAAARKVAEKTARAEDQGKMSKVKIILDDTAMMLDVPYEGINVLDAALAKGADLPFACKGGVCCTCRAKLISGEVEMTLNYSLEPDEVEAGFILTCQAHPKTDEVVIDFDQQ